MLQHVLLSRNILSNPEVDDEEKVILILYTHNHSKVWKSLKSLNLGCKKNLILCEGFVKTVTFRTRRTKLCNGLATLTT